MAAEAETASAAETWNATIFVALTFAMLLIAAGLAGAAFAAGPHADGGGAAHGHGTDPGHHHSFGSFEPAAPEEATRTVDVTMEDIAFEPRNIAIEAGETVRFVVRNHGQLVHEFNVGTTAMHAEHQKQMAMMVDHGMLEADKINTGMMSGASGGGQMSGGMMSGGMMSGGMMHDNPNAVLLEPGQTGEVVLKFIEPTTLEFACNVPGHYETGMVGTLHVTK